MRHLKRHISCEFPLTQSIGKTCRLHQPRLQNIYSRQLKDSKRIHIVWDKYIPNSLKASRWSKKIIDDTPTFSIIKNKNAKDLIHDLSLISKWGVQVENAF